MNLTQISKLQVKIGKLLTLFLLRLVLVHALTVLVLGHHQHCLQMHLESDLFSEPSIGPVTLQAAVTLFCFSLNVYGFSFLSQKDKLSLLTPKKYLEYFFGKKWSLVLNIAGIATSSTLSLYTTPTQFQ